MSARSIKIEQVDGERGREHTTKSYIRLRGKWLTEAGFKPGTRVQVQVMASGQIVLTSEDLIRKDRPVSTLDQERESIVARLDKVCAEVQL